MKPLKLISWNVNGIRAVENKGFLSILQSWNADLVCLQETKAHKNQLSKELLEVPNYQSWWHLGEKLGYSGVAIYSKISPISIQEGLGVPEIDAEGRVIIAEFNDFFLFNCYFPNSQDELRRIDYRLDFGDALIQQLTTKYSHKTRIICGDFNVSHKAIDLARPKANEENPGYSLQERQWMDKFIGLGYTDTFRMFNQNPHQYSWWSYRAGARAKNIGWRLDYFCIDTSSKNKVQNGEILPDIMGSDHCPVTLTLLSNHL